MGRADRILVLHVPRRRTPFGEPVEPHQLHLMAAALRSGGWRPTIAEFDPATVNAELERSRPAVVFNLCYGWRAGDGGSALDQPGIAELLAGAAELVGADHLAQRRCQDKARAAELAAEVGVGVPRELGAGTAAGAPVVVKPRHGAAHRDVRVLRAPLAPGAVGPDELVQEYIDGPEFTVAVVVRAGVPRALTAARIRYGRSATRPRVYDWATTTWGPASVERFGLAEVAVGLFGALGLRDYARFDFRVDRERGPVLLDANALPNLAPRQLLASAARWDGIAYPDLVRSLAASARRRVG